MGDYLSPVSWKCTMTWSAYMGLPLSLEGAGKVLGLSEQKLKEGKDLIRYFCVPCKPTKLMVEEHEIFQSMIKRSGMRL